MHRFAFISNVIYFSKTKYETKCGYYIINVPQGVLRVNHIPSRGDRRWNMQPKRSYNFFSLELALKFGLYILETAANFYVQMSHMALAFIFIQPNPEPPPR